MGLNERSACVVWRQENGQVRRVLDVGTAAFAGWHVDRLVLADGGRRLLVGLSRPPFNDADHQCRCYVVE